MPHLRFFSTLLIVAWFSSSPFAQDPAARAPQTIGILQKSFSTMGGTIPTDSTATGTVKVVAGSKTDTGTIRILTRGLKQSAEQVTTSDGALAEVYADGLARVGRGTKAEKKSLEFAATAQTPAVPLLLLAVALNNPDTLFEYVGLEVLDGSEVHHVRFKNSFQTNPQLRHLAEFSVRDVWIDATSSLPRKLSYERREGGGTADRIKMEISYSDYRSVDGVLYPFLIEKYLNGTPWTTITIQNVTLNNGLSDADFPVQ